MRIIHREIGVSTEGNTDVIDITPQVREAVSSSRMSEGSVILFVGGSTASLTTIEYEPNLVEDFRSALERLVPSGMKYAHTKTWGDHNGHSHVRASLMGPSLQIPFLKKKLQLGTWQQVVLVDFDEHPRQRRILTQIIGE